MIGKLMAACRRTDKPKTAKKQVLVNKDGARQLKLLRLMTEYMPDGLLIIRPDKSIVYQNRRARELFRRPGALKDHQTDALLSAGYYDENGNEIDERFRPVSRVLNGETLENLHVKAVRAEQTAYLSISGKPVYINDKLICAILSVRDISDRSKAFQALRSRAVALEAENNDLASEVEALRRADSSKNVFLSTLSHELRNPIASISAALQLMEMTKDTGLLDSTKGVIRREMEQLRRLVNDLLDITRINMNRIELKKEPVDLAALALSAVEDHVFQFDEKGVRLEPDISRDAIYIDADPVRMTQLIGNLLHNALKFTDDEHGYVQLRIQRDGDDAVICVADNGIGISEEFLPVLFEPFTQSESSLERSRGGLGLGLSIVKGIAELHGGSVGVTSDGPGKGASFCVRLPLRREPVSGPDAARMAPDGKFRRVLLIEDNKDLAELLRTTLMLFGHTARAVCDGQEGIRAAKEWAPDVILCDIRLPVVDGYEVVRQLKSDGAMKDVRMIALTGYEGAYDIQSALSAGFDAQLTKPLDMAALLKLMDDER